MPRRRKPGPSVKDNETWEGLRREGNSEEKTARFAIAGAANTSRTKVAKNSGAYASYGEWTKGDVMRRARELDIEGRSSVSKGDLVDAPSNH